ncbi:MAG: hypothetical protein HY329_15035 [Chloroflexi bacterium]|nr:hypothetical protein [Chloroflexota bacterium]
MRTNNGNNHVEDEKNLDGLEPGDALSFWAEDEVLVQTIFDCTESIGGDEVSWRWLFLDDGSLIEVSPDGQWRYREHEVVPQGGRLFEELVAPGGTLEEFESRVRQGTSGRNPVVVELRGKPYRVTSTGTVKIERKGAEPTLAPWAKLGPNPDNNIYFSLVETEDEESGALGIWTNHVCLSFGRPIDPTDLEQVFRKERPKEKKPWWHELG